MGKNQRYKRRRTNTTPSKEDKDAEIKKLVEEISKTTPAPGYAPPLGTSTPFSSLPLSSLTLSGLKKDSKTRMTDIQHSCIPHALAGRDILGSARTGSGKTLAFLIPLLERLHRGYISSSPTLGGIILSPTRELATQTFTVLRAIGCNHNLSACLLIGGMKEILKEQQYVSKSNIFVATPGRLLQHLEQSPNLDCTYLEVLILDEADRILDMGFRFQLERILEYLPQTRQTMLFSATQTKKVKDLAMLSLQNPEYIFVHQSSQEEGDNTALSTTPLSLKQMYMTVPLHHKLDLLYSFLKTHLSNKIIAFFSTCSQVRHADTLFCHLQPGIPVLCMHGKMNQDARNKVCDNFMKKRKAILLATDVVSRGLDFPAVDWVVSVDAPDTKEEYVHRVGRTARYTATGKSLLFLSPSEELPFIEKLTTANLTIKKLGLNPEKALRVSTGRVAGTIVAKDANAHNYAKKAFRSYLRSYLLMPMKDVFLFDELDLEKFAVSLGLAECPPLTFLNTVRGKSREQNRAIKNQDKELIQLKEDIKKERLEKMGLLPPNQTNHIKADENQDVDFLFKKRNDVDDQDDQSDQDEPGEVIPNKKKKLTNTKILFDQDGNEKASFFDMVKSSNQSNDEEDLLTKNEEYMTKVRDRLNKTKEQDKNQEKIRIKDKHKKRRNKEKDEEEEDQEQTHVPAVTLGSTESSPLQTSGANPTIDTDSDSSSSDDSSSSSSTSESDSSHDSDSEDEMDSKAREEFALSLIRQ